MCIHVLRSTFGRAIPLPVSTFKLVSAEKDLLQLDPQADGVASGIIVKWSGMRSCCCCWVHSGAHGWQAFY
jgi:hypothetical protein